MSSAELAVGEQFKLQVAHRGCRRPVRLAVALVCEERASYRQGTNTRTDTELVVEIPLDPTNSEAATEAEPVLNFDTRIPPEAMHSFKGKHNAIAWKIRVKGEIERWPDFKRTYPLVVAARETP